MTVIVKDAVTDVFLFRMERVSNAINHPSRNLFLFSSMKNLISSKFYLRNLI